MDTFTDHKPRQVAAAATNLITVIGVGGAGGNAVNNMIEAGLEGVAFVVANTDAQALEHSLCERRIQLGQGVTRGLGAGAKPDIGKAAAEESRDEIAAALAGASMLFVAAGMGGGTGTGAAPIIAEAGRAAGLLTVGVVSKPFAFEGAHRMRQAEAGIDALSRHVDTLIVIPNQNLFRVADEKTTFADAFRLADAVLRSGVRSVTDLIVLPGLINLDFADIRSIMSDMGKAVMGTGEAKGENRAIVAAEAAISNPLLDNVSVMGAQNVLINITGGLDLALHEVDEAANRVRREADPDANIIFGSAFDGDLDGAIRVSVIATGRTIATAERPSASVSGNVLSAPANGRQKVQIKSHVAVVQPSAATPAPANDATTQTSAAASAGTDADTGTSSAEAGVERDAAAAPLPPAPQMHYVVCDLSVGVRIFKVPLAKVALVRNESHADRIQIFDSLHKAKKAADNLTQRIAYRRLSEGLSIKDNKIQQVDYQRWTENDVPLYFI